MNSLKEIENVFKNEHKNIPKSQIDRWKQSSDMETLGALVELITDKKYFKYIKPALEFKDYYPFLFNYYLTCITNKYDGEWVHSNYMAAYELKNFIEGIWDDKQLSEYEKNKLRKEIKNKLEQITLTADKNLKEILINGLFEHLFDNKAIKNYFKDWKHKKNLKSFYEYALNKSKTIK